MQNLENLFSCGSEIFTTLNSESHSSGRCDVVCGPIVRRVKEQVDSVFDWECRVGSFIIRLYSLFFLLYIFTTLQLYNFTTLQLYNCTAFQLFCFTALQLYKFPLSTFYFLLSTYIFYSLHLAPCTLHLAPCTLHLAPCTLHLTPYTLHLTPYTSHLTLHTLQLTTYNGVHASAQRWNNLRTSTGPAAAD